MRKRGSGSFLITNNGSCLQGRRRQTGQALSYPRALLRSFAQALTEEYSQYGVHIANVIIDGVIDSPGTRALPIAEQRPELVMNPSRIAEAYFYLHTQDRTCWSHELILSPNGHRPSIENSWRFGTRDGKPAAVR
jgi:NAD(P)-dependent dehydrogenase (short-subunit alcohol dehydrogenase family)